MMPFGQSRASGFNNPVTSRIVVSGTGAGDGVFVYSGTPALGNPPIAWMTNGSLTDPKGNVLPAVMGVAASGSFAAGDTRITPSATLTYSGTPALGNLIYSESQSGGTDTYGNVYLPDTVSYSGAGTQAFLMNGNGLGFYTAPGPGGPWTAAGGGINYASGGGIAISGPFLEVTAPVYGSLVATVPASFTPETWHPITLDTGWSAFSGYAAPQYRITPMGELELAGMATFGSTQTVNHNLNNTIPLPAAYRPTSSKLFRSYDGLGGRATVQIAPTGVIEALGSATYPYTYCEIDATLSLL